MKVVLMSVMTAVGDRILLRKEVSYSLKVNRTEGKATKNGKML